MRNDALHPDSVFHEVDGWEGHSPRMIVELVGRAATQVAELAEDDWTGGQVALQLELIGKYMAVAMSGMVEIPSFEIARQWAQELFVAELSNATVIEIPLPFHSDDEPRPNPLVDDNGS